MAYRLLRGGQIVYVHRSSTTTPTGRTSTLTRGEVGRAGTVYEDLPAHVVEQIESGVYKDGTWEEVEQVDGEWVAVDPDLDDEEDHRSDEADLDADRSVDLVLELKREKRRSADLEDELAQAREALETASAAGADASSGDAEVEQTGDDRTVSHGHEADDDHVHEVTFDGLTGERLKALVDMHALPVKGTGAQGKLKNDDMLGALKAEHGQ